MSVKNIAKSVLDAIIKQKEYELRLQGLIKK